MTLVKALAKSGFAQVSPTGICQIFWGLKGKVSEDLRMTESLPGPTAPTTDWNVQVVSFLSGVFVREIEENRGKNGFQAATKQRKVKMREKQTETEILARKLSERSLEL